MTASTSGETEFSGQAGAAVVAAFSAGSVLGGLFLLLPLAVMSWILNRFGSPDAAVFITHIVLAFALARFALNGAAGEVEGSLFSGEGGSLVEVVAVALRYLLLSVVGLVPLYFWARGFDPKRLVQEVSAGQPPWGYLAFGIAIALFWCLSPPVFLAVSASATDLREVFSPGHWRRIFGGRLADLFLVYVLSSGVLTLLVVASVLILFVATLSIEWALVSGALLGSFALGLSLDVLGRLSGLYTLGAEEAAAQARAVTQPAAPPAAPPPPPDVVPKAWDQFERDPAGAIAALEEWRESRAPVPALLVALGTMYLRRGQEQAALAVGKEGIPLCLSHGDTTGAASLFEGLLPHADGLALTREQLVVLAGFFRARKDLKTSAYTYALALRQDTADARAVKGLIQVADSQLHENGNPREALRLYNFLLEVCPASPLAEFMREGKAKAEKKIAEGASG